MNFSKTLIAWYLQNKRDLPWRKTTNPYFIWLSEIILQQTRVAQGKPYYESFITRFPTVYDLANASEEEVLKLWQGLGYYSRARNLHSAAQTIVEKWNGIFPLSYTELLLLKGIGEYTAAAIASFSYNEPIAVVDGNVFRVLSRIFGMDIDISLGSTKKEFQKKAQDLLPVKQAAIFNQAIMEFGALQCVPKNPNCSSCVFNANCYAYLHNKIKDFPVKSKKTKTSNRYFNYLVIRDKKSNFLISKRQDKGIWYNLYEFTLLEFEDNKNIEDVILEIEKKYNPNYLVVKNESEIIHKLSHQHLHIRFFELKYDKVIPEAIPLFEMLKLPMPVVIHNFIASNYL
ncbi:Adenine DNA glycosylase [Flavobacterium sp. 9AF]|uniref:A/G-specific adenine glycosylase n=1 Tax=Flavobacterium sp. 9AF TaxID=2653142 RepID=UPI0012F018D7|nr:A/G-specific adenine glycosylase [Flavobacterium sp. 9AF]VXB40958.1 Adenine DNA glycosylase [Flavobacterium sp. 9AF]